MNISKVNLLTVALLLCTTCLTLQSLAQDKGKKQNKKEQRLQQLMKFHQAAYDKNWVFQATSINSSNVQSVTRDNKSASTPTQINPGSNWTIVMGDTIIMNYVTVQNDASSSVGAMSNIGNQNLSAYIEEVLEYEVEWKGEGKPISIMIRGRGSRPYNPAFYNVVTKIDFDISIYSNGKANATVRAGGRGGTLYQYQGQFYLYDDAPITREIESY